MEKFTPLLKKKAQSFSYPFFEYEDLYQVALIGLWKAYKNYDINRSRIHFGYYSSIVITTELSIYYRKNNKPYKNGILILSLNASIDKEQTMFYLDDLTDEEEIIEKIAEKIDLQNAISLLKVDDFNIINDFYFKDLSRNEISENMNLGKAAISKRMKKAIKNLSNKYLTEEEKKKGCD